MKPMYIGSDIYNALVAVSAKDRSNQITALGMHNKADQKFWTGSRFIAHPRYGNNKVWHINADLPMACKPSLDHYQTKSFSEITDQRSQDLLHLLEITGKRLAVFWSGGIDSTVILCALLKHLPRVFWPRIDVYMNNYSFLENPSFYQRVIKHYDLNCVNISSLSSHRLPQLFAQSIVTDGEPADKLWLVEIGLRYFQEHGASAMRQSLQSGRHSYICFLSRFMDSEEANSHWDYVIDNINDTQAPVSTIADLFWWINFNYHWNGHLLSWYAKHAVQSKRHWKNYQANYHPWYNTLDYQSWSFCDSNKERVFFNQPGEYKMEAKRYIFDLHKDPHYLHYKTKLGSGRRGTSTYNSLVIMEDGTSFDPRSDLAGFLDQYCLLR